MDTTTTDEIRPTEVASPGGFYRLGAWSATNPAKVLASWAVVVLASILFALVGVTGQGLFERLDNGVPEVHGEAAVADELLAAETGDEGTALTLLIHGVDPLDSRLADTLDEMPEQIDAVAQANPDATVELNDPREGLLALEAGATLPADAQAGIAIATAQDGDGILVRVVVGTADPGAEEAESAAADASLAVLDTAADEIRADHPEATVYVSSMSRISDSYRAVAASDLERGEGIALPIALLIMIVVFGGFLAAGIPLLGTLVSVTSGLGALFAMSYFIGFDSMVINVITLLGLGLAIDYGLLILSRFREEAMGHEARDKRSLVHAVASTTAHAGRTVAFSGTIFAAAAAGLLVFEPAIMRAIGVGVIVVVLLAVLLSITFMPAMLALAGHRLAGHGFLVRLLGERHPISRLGTPAPTDGNFGRIARWAQRRPAMTTIGSLIILGAIATPALAMVPTNDVSGALPRAASQFGFIESLNEEFPSAGRTDVQLVVRSDGASTAQEVAAAWGRSLDGDPRVEAVGEGTMVGEYATLTISPAEEDRMAVVELARDQAPQGAGVTALVTGSAAHDLDLVESIVASAPWAALVILALTFVLLFLMTGSVVMPLKSLFVAVFSLGSAVGLLVWGFQQGNLSGLLNFNPADVSGVDVLVLTITLAFGFGLSMDYEVFLLGRVIELRDQGVPPREAIWRGMQGSGRIITSAAMIMVVVFLGFTIGDLLVIKQMGAALAFLVALDATLVRLVLVPALMTWQERIMWWSPRWLRPVAERFRIRH